MCPEVCLSRGRTQPRPPGASGLAELEFYRIMATTVFAWNSSFVLEQAGPGELVLLGPGLKHRRADRCQAGGTPGAAVGALLPSRHRASVSVGAAVPSAAQPFLRALSWLGGRRAPRLRPPHPGRWDGRSETVCWGQGSARCRPATVGVRRCPPYTITHFAGNVSKL